MIYQTYPRTIM